MLDLIFVYPFLMKLILASLILLLFYNWKTIKYNFEGISNRTWIIILIIFSVGLIIRMYFVPHTHLVYFDEFQHINMAENILYSGKFCSCVAGAYNDCLSCYLMPYPAGYHTLQSIIFMFFGDSEGVAFNTNAVISSLSIILIFLLVYLIFKKESTALWSSFILAFLPVHLKFSGTAILEISSLFFIILALIFFYLYLLKDRFSLFLLFLSSLLYAVNTRPENILLLILIIPVIFKKQQKKELYSIKYIAAIVIFLILLIPLINLVFFGLNSEYHGWRDSFLQRVINIKYNILPTFFYWFNPLFTPLLLSIFFILGFTRVYIDKKDKSYFFSLYFLLSILICASYAAGNIMTFSDTSRYSIAIYLPVIIFSSYGIDYLFVRLKHLKRCFRTVILFLFIIFYIISLIPTYDFIFYKSTFNTEYDFILQMKDVLPANNYVISYNPPAIISSIHKKSVRPEEFLENFKVLEPNDRIILFKDYWWYSNNLEGSRFEEWLKERYTFEVIKKDIGNTYSFYDLKIKNQTNT